MPFLMNLLSKLPVIVHVSVLLLPIKEIGDGINLINQHFDSKQKSIVRHSFRCEMQPQVTNLFNYFKLIHLRAWTPTYFSLLLLLLFGSRLPSSVLHNPAMSF